MDVPHFGGHYELKCLDNKKCFIPPAHYERNLYGSGGFVSEDINFGLNMDSECIQDLFLYP